MFTDTENNRLKGAFRNHLELACGKINGRGWDRATEVYTLNAVRELIAAQTPFFNYPPHPAK